MCETDGSLLSCRALIGDKAENTQRHAMGGAALSAASAQKKSVNVKTEAKRLDHETALMLPKK